MQSFICIAQIYKILKDLKMNGMEEVFTAHIHQGSPVPTSQTCCSHDTQEEHPTTNRDEVVVLKAVPGRFDRLQIL